MGGVRDDWNGRPRVGTVGERSQAGVSALVTRRSTAELFPLISISGPVEAHMPHQSAPLEEHVLSADLDQRPR